ncbi:hypothetical protein [Pseudodonghicola flavimaris]|uniref:Uncharacterized protein n=1 Tax=Pseudodonghicola flavimaris TaxID=3050036 RepID=A0ABT7F4C3_9RHOB|nr:hypothetical protein [Pseudodonghicola flavimaris]MDK3019455.1 hypothetical protein [Pseudodonghicola flavimaris]
MSLIRLPSAAGAAGTPAASAGIGHNGGPSMEPGQVLRTHQWRRAQRALMPNAIPKLVLQMRISRAAELGMDYKTYARVRQYSGDDITGLLFSSNALRIFAGDARIPVPEAEHLEQVRRARKLALVHRPQTPERVLTANPVLDAADAAPRFTDSWTQIRDRVQGLIRTERLSGARVLVIGDAPLESEWMAAGRAAAYLTAGEYFRATG